MLAHKCKISFIATSGKASESWLEPFPGFLCASKFCINQYIVILSLVVIYFFFFSFSISQTCSLRLTGNRRSTRDIDGYVHESMIELVHRC